MKLWRDLAAAAGFGLFAEHLLLGILIICAFIGTLIYLLSTISGLALSIALLSFGIALEVLRSIGNSRQRALDQVWPGIFDLLRSGAEAGLTTHEQIDYLAAESPVSVRRFFKQLSTDVDGGQTISQALSSFQKSVGSRSGDFFAMVLLITTELGGRGEAGIWARASSEIRSEQQLLAQVLAKQGWVLGSAKMAVLAPWLIVFVLLSVESNRIAFATPGGTAVLFTGLALSVFAYFLTSSLGRLPMPQRVFNVS
jgi:tight adherence protein B